MRPLLLLLVFLSCISLFGSVVSSELLLYPSTVIDDCCCRVDTVENANREDIQPLLDQLVATRFFRYFKVNLFRECPLWVNDALCTEHGCSICECNEDEVPSYWTSSKTDRVSTQTPGKNFVEWRDQADGMWSIQGAETEMSYVNLAMYEEANTGYRNGTLIWEQIYRQNCFKSGYVDEMCTEERIFFRLISGLHTSITTHIFTKFSKDPVTDKWLPHVPLFEKAVANHPDRMKNLYFAYLFLLRAINRATPFLESFDYNTGNPTEDAATKQLVLKLLRADLLCAPNFDESVESVLIDGGANVKLKQEFKDAFRNISSIMDCVSCEKCKVFAKLQILGLGTALKILFEPEIDYPFERDEIIAMINTARQLSSSVRFVSDYLKQQASAQTTAQTSTQTNTQTTLSSNTTDQTEIAATGGMWNRYTWLVGGVAFVVFLYLRSRPNGKYRKVD